MRKRFKLYKDGEGKNYIINLKTKELYIPIIESVDGKYMVKLVTIYNETPRIEFIDNHITWMSNSGLSWTATIEVEDKYNSLILANSYRASLKYERNSEYDVMSDPQTEGWYVPYSNDQSDEGDINVLRTYPIIYTEKNYGYIKTVKLFYLTSGGLETSNYKNIIEVTAFNKKVHYIIKVYGKISTINLQNFIDSWNNYTDSSLVVMSSYRNTEDIPTDVVTAISALGYKTISIDTEEDERFQYFTKIEVKKDWIVEENNRIKKYIVYTPEYHDASKEGIKEIMRLANEDGNDTWLFVEKYNKYIDMETDNIGVLYGIFAKYGEVVGYEMNIKFEDNDNKNIKKMKKNLKNKLLEYLKEQKISKIDNLPIEKFIEELKKEKGEVELTVEDSYKVGNCEIGTRNFMEKYGLKTRMKIKELLEHPKFKEMLNNRDFKRVLTNIYI